MPSTVQHPVALPLRAVSLATGSPFWDRMQANRQYLMYLDPHRLLHNFYENAGLPTRGERYGGWESQGIAGHTLGHYLSALSLHVGATGDADVRARLVETLEALQQCQEARGTGYVGGIPEEDRLWDEIGRGDVRSDGFDLNGFWVPWYTVHKLFAGLLDAYEQTGEDLALQIVRRLGDWADSMLAILDDEQFQRMLRCEHGGMCDALAQLYQATGEERYLLLAERFIHRAFIAPLLDSKDELAGLHANTQIPKVIGLTRLSTIRGRSDWRGVATVFWDRVVNHHSYAIGGHSDHEHFGKPDELSNRLSTQTCETCNTYNMLKLSKLLFECTGEWEYIDYYEHALVNHILASQDPETGMVCYYVSLLPGTSRVYSTPDDSFWCCVGTGIENHTKYGNCVAFRGPSGDGSDIVIAMPIASRIEDDVTGFTLRLDTEFPLGDGNVRLVVERAPAQSASIGILTPAYGNSGEPSSNRGEPSWRDRRTVRFEGTWQPGDWIEWQVNMSRPETIAMPDNPDRRAIKMGPNVLAAVLPDASTPQPFDVIGQPTLAPTPGGAQLLADGNAVAPMRPFWQLAHEKTAVYLDIYTPQRWSEEHTRREAERQKARDLELRTVDRFRPGEMQDERDHAFEGAESETGDNQGRKWRHARAGGWFKFRMKVDPAHGQDLHLTFWGYDGIDRAFEVLAEGISLHTFRPLGTGGAAWLDECLTLPLPITNGKDAIEIMFMPIDGKMTAGLYGAAILRTTDH